MKTNTNSDTEKILELIQSEWIQVSEVLRPKKVWICSYKPIDENTDYLHSRRDEVAFTSIESAWFLNERGLEARKTDEFSRFAAAHLDKPWNSAEAPRPSSPIWFKGNTFEFGLVFFARYKNTDLYYLQFGWGKLHGRGYVIGLENEKFGIQRELWIS